MSDLSSAARGVTIDNVNLSFGHNHVLKDISLTIEPGEFFAFLGPSGCGKTTLLRLIAGFGEASSGRVLIGDDDVTGLPPWRRNVGMVFQSYALWPHMTVRKNVAFGLEERHVARAEINDRVNDALDLVGLRDLAGRRPSQLSGGQQQRVALARTVVVEPAVLLLDEPLSNLDAKLRVQMRQELLALQRKLRITTIFVTHDQEEANSTADRIAVMKDGIIQQVGAPADLYDDPVNHFVANFLGTANVFEGQLAETADGYVFRSDDGVSVDLKSGGVAGGAASIVFRPQNVIIEAAGEHAGENAGVRLDGVVNHREFLGSLVRYTVIVGAHTVLVDDAHRRGQAALEVGAPVVLNVDENEVVVLAH